jgi:exonuclease SbcC
LRSLGDDFAKIKLHISEELNELNSKLNNLKIKKSEIETKGKELKDKKSEKDRFINDAEIEVAGISSDMKELANIVESLEEKQESDDDLSRTESDLASLGAVDYDAAKHIKIREEFGILETKKSRADVLQGEVKRIGQVENMIIGCQDKIKHVETQIKEIRSKLEELSFSTEEHTNAERKVKEAQDKLNQTQIALKEAEHRIELSSRDLETINQRIAGNQKIADEIKSWTIERTYLEKLESILDDFKISLIGRVRPTLSAYASGLLSELTENKYQDMELDENYDIYISEQGEKFPLERFSGGEKDLANLCLRLAISFMISESSAVGFSFIILDEIFGSQDISRKENIMNLLAKLKGRFRQIFLITHIEDVKDSVENLLYVVENENGTSQVIVQ